mgnify:CR=1 FL=1
MKHLACRALAALAAALAAPLGAQTYPVRQIGRAHV